MSSQEQLSGNIQDAPLVSTSPSQKEDDRRYKKARRQLSIAIVLCFIFMAVEAAGGIISHSLAILTDAAHMLTDVAGLLISLVAIMIARRTPTANHTFGFARLEVLGAIISVLLIWVLTGVLIYEGVLRVLHPHHVDGMIMFITATFGLLVNLLMMKVLHQGGGHGHSHGGDDHGHSHGGGDHGHSHDLGALCACCCRKKKKNKHGHDHGHSHGGGDENINVKAAYIHVLGDLIQSIGVMIAAVCIWVDDKLTIIDPICTFLFSVLVLFTTFGILKRAYAVLMNSVPGHVHYSKILLELQQLPTVSEVHDLHIWSITSGKTALAVHLVTNEIDSGSTLQRAQEICEHYGIRHSTVQVEAVSEADRCREVNDHCAPPVKSCHKKCPDHNVVDTGSYDPVTLSVEMSPRVGKRSDHGHSHGDHGHSHGDHGHSHGGHGHSHGGHGHSHDSHGHSHDSHGHSHGSHSGHSHGSHSDDEDDHSPEAKPTIADAEEFKVDGGLI